MKIFSTCPQSRDTVPDRYLQRVVEVSRWSERFGCEGILVYSDNGLVDPWLVSQVILQSTSRLCPLVAVQPAYMHPYTAAKMTASLAYLHRRRIYLNMLAGGFKNDLEALNDQTPHDDRYARTTEYTLIMKKLLAGGPPLNHAGRYYKVINLKLSPPIPADLTPGILISGSSDAGLAAAREIGATAIKYPKPLREEEKATDSEIDQGIRLGIIARADSGEAWRIARERFPEDRKGQLTHQLAMKVSDSHWHKQLSRMEESFVSDEDPYWMGPFQNYKTFCPYLVGTYKLVADVLGRYLELGFRTVVLDIPPSEEELEHTSIAIGMARDWTQS